MQTIRIPLTIEIQIDESQIQVVASVTTKGGELIETQESQTIDEA
jgi:hypothetical protein